MNDKRPKLHKIMEMAVRKEIDIILIEMILFSVLCRLF